MASYFVFYRAADPSGNIMAVSYIEQAEADEALAADPELAYVVASSNINKDDYFITVGPPRALSLRAPVVPDVMHRAFYKAAFSPPSGGATNIISAGPMSKLDADLAIAADTTLAYVSSVNEINPALYYINNSLLTSRQTMTVSASKTTMTADGVDTVTISNIPAGATVTLFGTADFAEESQIVGTGSTTLVTTYNLPHVFRFERTAWVTKELTINAV